MVTFRSRFGLQLKTNKNEKPKKREANTGAEGRETTATAGETADEAEAQKAARLANYEDLDKRLILLGSGPGQTRLGKARRGQAIAPWSVRVLGSVYVCVFVCVLVHFTSVSTHTFSFSFRAPLDLELFSSTCCLLQGCNMPLPVSIPLPPSLFLSLSPCYSPLLCLIPQFIIVSSHFH